MKNYSIAFFSIIVIYSFATACNYRPAAQKNIIGDWDFSKERVIQAHSKPYLLSPFPSIENNIGFDFINDSVCIYKQGYFKTNSNNYDGRSLTFLGDSTKYKIEDGVLKVWNLEKHGWDAFKIHLNTKDSLVFQTDSIFDYFVKAQPPSKFEPIYDELIVSSSGCFGSCPINRILLKSTGEVIYYGAYHNTINGLFTSHITKSEFLEIEKRFYNVNCLNLKNFYNAGWTDDNTINLTFVKNDRTIKQIEDYGRQSPPGLQFAYGSVRYLYQRLKLTPLAHDTSNDIFHNHMNFENAGHKFYLFSRSECFYLATLLYSRPVTSKNFKAKYEADINNFDTSSKVKVLTDGQLFKFVNNSGKSITYDLGYNYFDRNGLNNKFIDKTPY